MYALRYALDAGISNMPNCWNTRLDTCQTTQAVCGLSPVEASPKVNGTSTGRNSVKPSLPIPIKTKASSVTESSVAASADQALKTLARPSMPVPIKSAAAVSFSMSSLTGLTPDLPRRLLSKPSAPIPIKSTASSTSPLSVPIGVSPRRTPTREPLWSEAEMTRFWAVIEPYVKQLISGEAPMPAHDMELWDCERDSVENIEGCLLAVQDLICGGNYSKALAGIRAIRLYFEIPENSSRKAVVLLRKEDELEVFKHLFMKQDPVRKRLLDDSQRPHSF